MNGQTDELDRDLIVAHARFPGAYVLILRGTADMFTAEDLDVDFAAATMTGLRLVVDLGALEHGDETLLNLLLDAHRARGVELVGPLAPGFRRRLDTAGIADWFTVRPTLTCALDH
ncbi:anti-sigma factor antagonist [Streptomyces sp. NPDC088752]|uniref:anti-sigma factor antagonist n=1 Tax=Streptomyces sp. NPDC088752 TaxID=3154963 RepID=UPI00341805A5